MASYGSINSSTLNHANSNSNGEHEPLVEGSKQSNASSKHHSLWARLVFGWFTPLLHRGNEKKKLDQEDLGLISFPYNCGTHFVSDAFERNWKEELKRSKPSVARCLGRSFGRDFILAGFLKLFHDLCIFVGPQVLNGMIYYLRDADAPASRGLFLTALVTMSQLTMSLCLRHYFFKCYLTGLRTRTAIIMAVYKKALVLASGERQTRTLGEITNLMSIDAKRLQDIMSYGHAIWYSVLQIALGLFFLWQQLGASCLGGVFVIIVMIPVTKVVAKTLGGIQKRLMKVKDDRIKVNTEVLSTMKVIKLQAWEESFQKRILSYRETELGQLFHYYVVNAASIMLWNSTPLFVALATFAVYVWSGQELDVASALTALALFDILRFPLFMLPQIINRFVEAGVSLNRIRSFLLCEEHNPVGVGELDSVGIRMDKLSAAYESKKPKFEDADTDAKTKELAEKNWEVALLRSQLDAAEKQIQELLNVDKDAESAANSDVGDAGEQSANLLCLSRINFECKKGELIAVVGTVGCGKSSFLNAVLGEVKSLAGTTSVKGSIGYFSQTPFILNATVKANILFGHVDEEVDEKRYQHTLDCCALRHDLNILPEGDMTEIGEKGITLSGGQKARVALSRAVYHQADISLIDDALSAVDAHVAKDLFHNCIVDELMSDSERQRSVILVTNAIQFLNHPRVDRIIVIQHGRIAEQGSYAELANKPNSQFARFLAVMEETGISPTAADDDAVESLPEADKVGPGSVEVKRRRSSVKEEQRRSKKDLDSKPKDKATLMTAETHATGHVDFKVYLAWARSAGGWWVPIVIILLQSCIEGVRVLSKWWLTYWSANGKSGSQSHFLAIYGVINLSSPVISFFVMLALVTFGLRASRRLYSRLLEVIMSAPMSFFDTTPIGRIVNRFSKDMYTIDEELLPALRMYLNTTLSILSTIFVISAVTPIFTACLIPIIAFYLNEQRYFTITYRELKRLDSVNRSPIYALLGETVDGCATIRAFSAAAPLIGRITSILDVQQHAYYLTCTAQSWLAVRLELIGTLIITFACLAAVLEHGPIGGDDNFAGLVGLSISFALSVTQSLNWSVRMASDFEASMVAVERVKEYCEVTSEAARVTDIDSTLPENWPNNGEIIFEGVKLRYRPGLPLVLKGLDLRIPPGSKVGVVGRTGAGKSTLMIAMLRIVELDSGKILIDGVDSRLVGVKKLRSQIAVIPQDPTLFSGSVRNNLDPFNDFADEDLKRVLEHVGLYAGDDQKKASSGSLSSLSLCTIDTLEDEVSEGGTNFSVGQRQLLVIARALLCGASIVIMDEATAAVDADTDARIQKVMRTEFANATCITVAHRLNTIMDSDYILVMDDGRAAEFDQPKTLLEKGGMFRDLVQAAALEE